MDKKEIFKILYDKDTMKTYSRLQKIEYSIDDCNELYDYFEDIKEMLINKKTSIRVRGFRIICKLSKWDNKNKINKCINLLLNELDDDKPTAVRQCLNSLNILLKYKPELSNIIQSKLKEIELFKYKDSMRPLIKKDMDFILKKVMEANY